MHQVNFYLQVVSKCDSIVAFKVLFVADKIYVIIWLCGMIQGSLYFSFWEGSNYCDLKQHREHLSHQNILGSPQHWVDQKHGEKKIINAIIGNIFIFSAKIASSSLPPALLPCFRISSSTKKYQVLLLIPRLTFKLLQRFLLVTDQQVFDHSFKPYPELKLIPEKLWGYGVCVSSRCD